MYQKSSYERGFTLIELLVVIAIIGTLASVVLASLDAAKQKSRDGSRRAQLQQVQTALQMYYLENQGVYPPYTASLLSDISTYIVPRHMSRLPLDPTWADTTNGYRYVTDATQKMYTLLMREESNANNWCEVDGPSGDPGVWGFAEC